MIIEYLIEKKYLILFFAFHASVETIKIKTIAWKWILKDYSLASYNAFATVNSESQWREPDLCGSFKLSQGLIDEKVKLLTVIIEVSKLGTSHILSCLWKLRRQLWIFPVELEKGPQFKQAFIHFLFWFLASLLLRTFAWWKVRCYVKESLSG